MKLSFNKSKSFYTISIVLNIALAAECLFLVQQNRELKNSQSGSTMMQAVEPLKHGESVGPGSSPIAGVKSFGGHAASWYEMKLVD